MKRILYLSLLLVIPFIIHADHGRNRLNGKWISPYFNKQIKIKANRHELKIKGLTRRGWTYFTATRRNVFEDCNGNRVRIKNIHEMVYVNRFRGERIKFVKRRHNHHNHVCNSGCAIGDDYFGNFNNYRGSGDYYNDSWGYNDTWGNGNRSNNRNRQNNEGNSQRYSDSGFDGEYHVREIDEYVTLNKTRNGLRAKKKNGKWIEYSQNKYRKNEYVDRNGNKYLVRSDGGITWKSKDNKVSLNLKK